MSMEQGGMSSASTAERLARLEAALEQTTSTMNDLSAAVANLIETRSKGRTDDVPIPAGMQVGFAGSDTDKKLAAILSHVAKLVIRSTG